MPRKKSKPATKATGPRKTDKSDASVKKIQNYEDTLEEDGVDDFMFKRDKIGFRDDNDDSEEEDYISGDRQEVFGLKQQESDSEDFEEEDDEEVDEEDAPPVKKGRKEKKVEDKSHKGRYGKEDVSSDEDGSELNTEDEYDQEGWGRQYYSKPSNARAKEGSEELLDERREEERELEEKEVKRLQRKAREAITSAGDWGLDELNEDAEGAIIEEDEAPAPVAAPTSADPAILMKHLAAQEPVKLALAHDFPLIVKRLEKTARGIAKMEDDTDGEGDLHKGLGWLHYQTLLTYATTLAFYLHLAALPPSSRPDFATHPIVPRLLQLKEGVAMLEDLDFDAGSVSEDPLVLNSRFADDDDDDEEINFDDIDEDTKKEMIARMRKAQGRDWEEDAEGLWDDDEDLEDGELDDLMEEAEIEEPVKKSKKSKKEKKEKKSKKVSSSASSSTLPAGYSVLEEPDFVPSSSKRSSSSKSTIDSDDRGDPLALSKADAADKSQRKHSLRFHTSKIAATAARRDAARRDRMGGDEDLPYRDLKRGRDDALRKNGPQGSEGEALDGGEWSEKDKKTAREVMDMDIDMDMDERNAGEEDGEGYYDLVKRQKREEKDAKKEEYESARAAERSVFDEVESGSGPRSLTRAIEKNRGLTPHRAKSVRNPRVKKREAFEKAKRKVASQRAVYKGGQGALGGTYQGEKTGISTVTKSRKFGDK